MRGYHELHIYPQQMEHDEAYIVGTHAGLVALRDALTRAIERNNAVKCSAMPSDGEGYWVLIAPVDPAAFESMDQPYSCPREDAPHGKWPHELGFDWASASEF